MSTTPVSTIPVDAAPGGRVTPGRPVVLVLRALGLGDFAASVPALRALRHHFTEHEIVLAAPQVLAPLVGATGAVDRLVATRAYVRGPIDRLDWAGPPPAVAVNLHGRGPQSHQALRALHPGRLLAFACDFEGVVPDFSDGPPWRDDEHEVSRWCRLLRWYAIRADPAALRLPAPPPRGHTGVVVVHPGASTAERRWPVERFAAVAQGLRADGCRVVLTGGPQELSLAEAVARAAGLPDDDVLAARTDLAALAAITAHARLVVCGDTGVAHLATAFGTPSVVLFGQVSPRHWGPPADDGRHVALWHGPDGLTAITVDEVLARARQLLERAKSAAAAR